MNVRQGEMSTRILLLDDGQGRYRAMWVTILFGEEETSELMKPLTSSCDGLYTVHSPIHIQGTISYQIFSYFFFSPFSSRIFIYSIGAIVIEAPEIQPDVGWPYCRGIVIQLPREPSSRRACAPQDARSAKSSKELTMHALVGLSLIYQR